MSQLLYSSNLVFVLLAILLDLLQSLSHNSSTCLDKVNTSGSKRWNYDINLMIASHVAKISHEVSKLTKSLCFFKANFTKPSTKHTDSIIHIRTYKLDIAYKLIPLLSMHNFSNSCPQTFIFIDLGNTGNRNSRFFISFSELKVV